MTATQDIGVTEISELDSARARFRDELIEAELLVPSSVEGLYGRSGEFEDIIDTIDDAVKAPATPSTDTRRRVFVSHRCSRGKPSSAPTTSRRSPT